MRGNGKFWASAVLAVLTSCSSDSASGPRPDGGGSVADSGLGDVSVLEGGWSDAGGDASVTPPEAGSDSAVPEAASDPCPTLAVPTSCFGREVMYRDWGPSATGDGTYFSDQAPGRLGFTRVQNRIWVVKFKTEDASYFGRISAYGDSVAGVAWISDQVCDAAFAENKKLIALGTKGGGSLTFVVVRDADVAKLESDSALASVAKEPRLRAGHCYYVAFENVTSAFPSVVNENYIETIGDECGASGNGTCSYLAMDFNHLLHGLDGGLISGNVIAGLTGP
ncbi:MAG TPA: hypothetical protein PKA88_23965 [Polyangiaceae bacterium]|nr:hypothetical protein [Polyangiaceae bacterium]